MWEEYVKWFINPGYFLFLAFKMLIFYWVTFFLLFFFIIIFLILIFYCYSITVVCLFSPSLHPTPAKPPSLLHLHPPPRFCPCVRYSSSCNPLSSRSPPYSPLSIVRLFLTSMSLVIFCLLFFFSIYYVPLKGEIIWYLTLKNPSNLKVINKVGILSFLGIRKTV